MKLVRLMLLVVMTGASAVYARDMCGDNTPTLTPTTTTPPPTTTTPPPTTTTPPPTTTAPPPTATTPPPTTTTPPPTTTTPPTTPAPTPPTCSSKFDVRTDTRLQGAWFDYTSGQTLETCCEKCVASAQCTAFLFASDVCILHSSVTGSFSQNGYYSAFPRAT